MPWEDGTAKYDLHRHFGGSISCATVHGLLAAQGEQITLAEVTMAMVCTGTEYSFSRFLSKFNILNRIRWSEAAISTSIDQVVADQAANDIDYSELSFSIDKYMDNHVKWTRPELIKFISDVFIDACARHRTKVNLILSLRMESDRDRQRVNAALVHRSDVVERLGGIDIVGDEDKFDADFYAPIFRDWRAAGKVTLAHVSEICGPQNAFDAITRLHVHRIRHGITAAQNPEVLVAARDLNVCFDVSLHSNLLAGTVPDLRCHHLPKLLAARCAVTLGTDDPVIFNCNLDGEYRLAVEHRLLGPTAEEVARNISLLRANSIRFSAIFNRSSYVARKRSIL